MIHHSWAPAHIAQNEDDDGAHPGRSLKTPAYDEPHGSEDGEWNQKTRSPSHGEVVAANVGRQQVMGGLDRAPSKLAQQHQRSCSVR